ncbi:helix-turn-helix domain-containing protein [Chitinophaga niastensis]|uniref:helix-turn-helix transcriptional regulator n=1 Tax=Chitinophaga niastensis TaxID=536980 RepID=UPI000D0DACA9
MITAERKIYNRIKSVLDGRNITYHTMASKLNISMDTLLDWCLNNKQPSIKSLYKIADVLKVSVCQLLV